MTTEKLFVTDSSVLRFEARVVRVSRCGDKPSLVLDRTAFYPEGGGQLGDQGALQLGETVLQVLDAQIDESGDIHHVLAVPPHQVIAGATVRGEVDARRRRDLTAQHTGQHMLSAALLHVAGAKTVSARLGNKTSTIDLACSALDDGLVARAEAVVNDAIVEDRAVRVLFPSPEQLARIPLRREPKVDHDVRVIEIEGLDYSACGGTHCSRTSQVGLVHVIGVERYKGMIRLSFLSGKRASDDYAAKDSVLRDLARSLTCGPLEVAAPTTKMRDELKARAEQISRLRAQLCELRAARLLADHPPSANAVTQIVAVEDEDDIAGLRALAKAITSRPDAAALVAAHDPASQGWLVVVECPTSLEVDAAKWLKTLIARYGGRGGGSPQHAEGRLDAGVDWEDVRRGGLGSP